VKVFPHEYKRALRQIAEARAKPAAQSQKIAA
jgi:hypothetical protein